MKIHANFQNFAAVNFDASKYIPSPSYGVSRFMLDRIGNEKARATTIVQYNPNSKFPMHEHIGGEEFLVLEGTFKDQFGEFGKGTYVRNPIGSKHEPWVEEDGCTIMVKLLQMAETGEGVEPLHIHYDNETEVRAKKTTTELGSELPMYHNDITGERVSMCWVDAEKELPINDHCKDGEELFVLEGSLLQGNNSEFKRWAWLRVPASIENNVEERIGLKAGPSGAQVYRKTGHLTQKAMELEKIRIDMETEELIS